MTLKPIRFLKEYKLCLFRQKGKEERDVQNETVAIWKDIKKNERVEYLVIYNRFKSHQLDIYMNK